MDGAPAPPPRRPGGLAARFFRWRDRLVGDPAFQAWAARFPLTRPIARRNARRLFDLAAGFVYAQALAAAVELRLFDLLAGGPLTTAEVAAAAGLPEDGAERLLAALAALDLLARTRGGAWRLAELGAAMRGAPGVAEMVAHHAMLYDDLRDPVALLRGQAGPTRLGAFWSYAGARRNATLGEAETAAYSRLMAASQAMVAAETLAACDLSGHRRLMDVGGGQGAFLDAVARAVPRLELALFDLPPVARAARARFAAEGRAVAVHGGDFFADPLPEGADVISLVRILHDHDDGPARAILAAVRKALPPGGTVLVAEPAGGPEGGRVGDAYFGLYFAAMGAGRPRDAATLRRFLADAGFLAIRHRNRRKAFLASVLTARVPG